MIDGDHVQILTPDTTEPADAQRLQRVVDLLTNAGLAAQGLDSITVYRAVSGDGESVLVIRVGPPLFERGELSELFRLTRREEQVAELLMRRYSNKEISRALGIKPRTAWRHTEKVLTKMDAGCRRNVERVVNRKRMEMSLLRT